MLKTLQNAFKVKDVRHRIFYVLMMLVVIRIGSQLPVPGVDGSYFKTWFESQTGDAFNFLDAFTGGSFSQMSIFALSITPYITSSIIIQLLTIAIPKLEEMQRDGEDGRKKLGAITRYVTIGLSLFESIAMAIGFGNRGLIPDNNFVKIIVVVVALTAGSAFLMWVGEQINEKGVGNGISIVLLINIVSRIPSDMTTLYESFMKGKIIAKALLSGVIIAAIIIGVVILVIILNGAERRIPVQALPLAPLCGSSGTPTPTTTQTRKDTTMDKNAIKKYAVWARRELLSRVAQKALQYGVDGTTPADPDAEIINGRLLTAAEKSQRRALIDAIAADGYEQILEEAAYTWFNRFCALRFMEVNNYLPSHTRVFTDENNAFAPQILAEAIRIELPGLDRDLVYKYKEANDDDALYKYLLITQCNALKEILPGMFSEISGYTELLFPDNLLREGSAVEQMIAMIPEDDWRDEVQIIGWLYQYYNSEKKDAVFAALKKNVKISKDNIPAATQLFTPDWIVRYMVETALAACGCRDTPPRP